MPHWHPCGRDWQEGIIRIMRLRVLDVALVLLIGVSSACAGGRTAGGSVAPDPRTITRGQIEEHHFRNAYDAVRTLHPNWLHSRGTDSAIAPSRVLVYQDNSRLGGIDELRGLEANGIAYIRYYNGTEASTRWGLDHGAGVIFVASRAGGTQ